MFRLNRLSYAVAAALCAAAAPQAYAQVTLDGSMGTSGALTGPNYQIQSAMGRQMGSNLFHSFGRFNVNNGESATFLGPNSVSNVIGRVTDGVFSNINGLVRSSIPGANLFLINPAGIVFGANASIDVSGSFHASTAHYLALADGGRFDAVNLNASVLTSAPPSAFGFTGPTPGILVSGSTLTGAPGSALTLTGGPMLLTGANLSAPGGTLSLASVTGAGEAQLVQGQVIPQAGIARGAIQLTNGTALSASSSAGVPAGRVVIRGGVLTIQDAEINVLNSETAPGLGVVVDATESLTMARSTISAIASGAGTAGPIAITSPAITLDGTVIATQSRGDAAAGAIDVQGNQLTLTGGATISSSATAGGPGGNVGIVASEFVNLSGAASNGFPTNINSVSTGAGHGGDVTVTAPVVTLDGAAIAASVFDTGAAGTIAIQANRVTLSNGAVITAGSNGPGAAGAVVINAAESLTVSGDGNKTGIVSNATAHGPGGGISISAPTVTLTRGVLTTGSDGAGAAGNIGIVAGDLTASFSTIDASATAAGPAGNIDVQAARVVIKDNSTINSGASSGATGRVSVVASDSITLARGDGTRAAGDTGILNIASGGGAGGGVFVSAPTITLDEGMIRTRTLGAGRAGDIDVQAGRLILRNGGQIDSSAFGSGGAGNLTVNASESVDISGTTAGFRASGLFTTSVGSGPGGDLVVRSPEVTVTTGTVNADALGTGSPGSITVETGKLALLAGGKLTSSSGAPGAGGRVNVVATGSITISGKDTAGNRSLIEGTNSGSGVGTDIVIATPVMTIDAGAINASTQGTGAAGDIAISAGQLVLSNNAQINSSTSAAGHGGQITIGAARVELASQGSVVSTSTGGGPGGRIGISASESLAISGIPSETVRAGIYGTTFGPGAGGDIDVSAPLVTLTGGVIAASSFGRGGAGNISVRGNRASLTSGARIDSSSVLSGDAGRVLIDTTGTIDISGLDTAGNRSQVSSLATGSGQGGEILLRAPTITVDGGRVLAEASGSGIAGEITITAGRLSLTRRGQASSSAEDDATGGRLTVTASEALTITDTPAGNETAGLFANASDRARGGEIQVTAPLIAIDGGLVSTNTSGTGAAGRMNLQARDVSVIGGGTITSSSLGASGAAGIVNVTATGSIVVSGRTAGGFPSTISTGTLGPGDGGDLQLTAPSVTVDGAVVRADTSGRGTAGRLGITADRVTISGGGSLASGTSAAGNGGTLNVTATDSILVTGSNPDGRSRIGNSSGGAGDAGEIFLSAPSIRIQDGGFVRGTASAGGAAGSIRIRGRTLSVSTEGDVSTNSSGPGHGGEINIVMTDAVGLSGGSSISASSTGRGDAGGIFIDAGHSLTLENSSITTAARSADGGNIEIKATDFLRMTDSRITTSVGTGFGNGGNITIDPTFVILDGSQIIANAFGGNGGNIDITTDALLKSGDSVIEASSALGIQGTIRISAPDSDLAGGLTPLPGGLFDPSLLLRESCSARAGRAGNSFVGVGHGGLPERPGTLAFSSYARAPEAGAQARAPVFALVEAFASACGR